MQLVSPQLTELSERGGGVVNTRKGEEIEG